MLWLVALVVAGLFLAALLLFLLWKPRQIVPDPISPLPAKPRPPLDCSVPAFTPPEDRRSIELQPDAKGGSFFGTDITLPKGRTLTLRENLTLLATEKIEIAGNIVVDGNVTQGVKIEFLCPEGLFKIDQASRVVAGVGADGNKDTSNVAGEATARGAGAGNGGDIRVVAGDMDLRGRLSAGEGGVGGAGAAKVTKGAGNAIAVGGTGGGGGRVQLCAIGTIAIAATGSVIGGRAGAGGKVDARAGLFSVGVGLGGPGGVGGDVVFQGILEPCLVTINNLVLAGTGGTGGEVDAAVGGASGGVAVAIGGEGGMGGNLLVVNAVIQNNGRVFIARGGDGGDAAAIGGDGSARRVNGRGVNVGGGASADGGDAGVNGGADPNFGAQPVPAPLQSIGKGGNAGAKGGDGATATSPSGTSSAQGGKSGAGVEARSDEKPSQRGKGPSSVSKGSKRLTPEQTV